MTEKKTNRTELDGYTTTDIFNESELQYKVESDEKYIYYTAVYRLKKNDKDTLKKLKKELKNQKSPLTEALQDTEKRIRELNSEPRLNTLKKLSELE